MDVRGMRGMHSAGAAHCEVCQHDTWVAESGYAANPTEEDHQTR
jgi:hypothetical protein